MSDLLEDRIKAAAPVRDVPLDLESAWSRGRRQRTQRRIGAGLAVVALLAGSVGISSAIGGRDRGAAPEFVGTEEQVAAAGGWTRFATSTAQLHQLPWGPEGRPNLGTSVRLNDAATLPAPEVIAEFVIGVDIDEPWGVFEGVNTMAPADRPLALELDVAPDGRIHLVHQISGEVVEVANAASSSRFPDTLLRSMDLDAGAEPPTILDAVSRDADHLVLLLQFGTQTFRLGELDLPNVELTISDAPLPKDIQRLRRGITGIVLDAGVRQDPAAFAGSAATYAVADDLSLTALPGGASWSIDAVGDVTNGVFGFGRDETWWVSTSNAGGAAPISIGFESDGVGSGVSTVALDDTGRWLGLTTAGSCSVGYLLLTAPGVDTYVGCLPEEARFLEAATRGFGPTAVTDTHVHWLETSPDGTTLRLLRLALPAQG